MEHPEQKKVLVTGGAGFIGSHFIRRHLDRFPQDQVMNLDALTYAGNPANLKDVEAKHPRNYFFLQGSISDPKLVDWIVKDFRPDQIVNFAAESHVDRSLVDAAPFRETNIKGTEILLAAAVLHGVGHFHHISTDEVFGAIQPGEDRKFSEETPYNPQNPYAQSKAESDRLVRSAYEEHGLPITITNCSNNFGPYHFPEKLIPLAITNIIEGSKVPVYGQGLQSRDWLYVEDHCRAIEAVIEKGRVGETYCVGGMIEAPIPNIEVVSMIARFLGKRPEDVIQFVTDRPNHDFMYQIDWTKLNRETGWEPQHDFKTWLGKTVDWYIENEWWWKPLKQVALPR